MLLNAKVFVASEETQTSETVLYGQRVVLLHRASQKFVTKSKISTEAGFRVQLETLSHVPSYVRATFVQDEVEADEGEDEAQVEQKYPPLKCVWFFFFQS